MKTTQWVLAALVACGAFGVGCKDKGDDDDGMSNGTGGTGGAMAAGISGFGGFGAGGMAPPIDVGGLFSFGLPGSSGGAAGMGVSGMGAAGMVATGSGGVAAGTGGVAAGTGGTAAGTGGTMGMGGECPGATFADFGLTLPGCCTPEGQCGIDGTAALMPGCTENSAAAMMAESMGAPPGAIPPPQPCP